MIKRYRGRASATVELHKGCTTKLTFHAASASRNLYIDWSGSHPKAYFDNHKF